MPPSMCTMKYKAIIFFSFKCSIMEVVYGVLRNEHTQY